MIDFKKQIDSFCTLLERVNVDDVAENQYCRNYLSHLLNHRKYFLNIYADVLEKITSESEVSHNELTFLDFGAGNGLLGIFAKHCGFGKVYINELDEVFLHSAKKISSDLCIEIDGFIHGHIQTVKHVFQNERLDAIAATDVIEHIYDLNDFFHTLSAINPKIISVFTTGSNPKNFFKMFRLKKLQRKDEYFGANPEDFALCGSEPHPAFIEIRKKIISENLQHIKDSEIKKLAKLTRGLDKKDLIKALESCQKNGLLPQKPNHPTNTCHPLTGSWTERILSIQEYEKIYKESGFYLKVRTGFYDQYKKGLKGLLNNILNALIVIFGLKISPFIVLIGKR